MTDTNPTQTDQTDRVEHRVERSYDVPATPEQVWEAIATAEGISSWMVPTQLDPQVGGAVSFDLGDFTSNGVITGYVLEPAVRLRGALARGRPRTRTSRPGCSSGSTRSARSMRRGAPRPASASPSPPSS